MVSSILSLIYQLIIGPLVLLFEFVFSVSYSHIDNPGICIIILSIVMNLMALPLYRRADAIQKKERDVETALKPGIDHIKKTFKGDERFFIMQTLYRQNSYSPVHVLKGSLSLFLQIPFFMAAYKMLSGLYILSGESFGPISDLGMPDGLIVLGPVTINLLPLLMTAINMVSSVIYLRGRDIKQKIQMFAVAAVFLVLLYRSPAGLVFYWTCNNVFSLLKRRKEPEEKRSFHGTYTGSFVLSCVYIALFIGIYIPSNAMKSSPLDFTDVFHYCDPSKYLIYPLVTSLGVLSSGDQSSISCRQIR